MIKKLLASSLERRGWCGSAVPAAALTVLTTVYAVGHV
jgi:hypothetical protein